MNKLNRIAQRIFGYLKRQHIQAEENKQTTQEAKLAQPLITATSDSALLSNLHSTGAKIEAEKAALDTSDWIEADWKNFFNKLTAKDGTLTLRKFASVGRVNPTFTKDLLTNQGLRMRLSVAQLQIFDSLYDKFVRYSLPEEDTSTPLFLSSGSNQVITQAPNHSVKEASTSTTDDSKAWSSAKWQNFFSGAELEDLTSKIIEDFGDFASRDLNAAKIALDFLKGQAKIPRETIIEIRRALRAENPETVHDNSIKESSRPRLVSSSSSDGDMDLEDFTTPYRPPQPRARRTIPAKDDSSSRNQVPTQAEIIRQQNSIPEAVPEVLEKKPGSTIKALPTNLDKETNSLYEKLGLEVYKAHSMALDIRFGSDFVAQKIEGIKRIINDNQSDFVSFNTLMKELKVEDLHDADIHKLRSFVNELSFTLETSSIDKAEINELIENIQSLTGLSSKKQSSSRSKSQRIAEPLETKTPMKPRFEADNSMEEILMNLKSSLEDVFNDGAEISIDQKHLLQDQITFGFNELAKLAKKEKIFENRPKSSMQIKLLNEYFELLDYFSRNQVIDKIHETNEGIKDFNGFLVKDIETINAYLTTQFGRIQYTDSALRDKVKAKLEANYNFI
jgi:hypothetical protein